MLRQEGEPPSTHYRGREIARTMHYSGAPWLVRESREREEDCAALLGALELREGQRVCDLGCGNGFYTLPLAERVGASGRVLAVDVQPQMLLLLEERARASELDGRIERVLCTEEDPRLPAGELDLVLLVDVYHELSHPEPVLRAVRESLAPGGRMVLVEFRGEDPSVPILPLHKMTKLQVLREVLPNGFRLEREFDELPWQHMLFFSRARSDELAARVRTELARAAHAMSALALRGGHAGIHVLASGARFGESFEQPAGPNAIWVQPPGTPSVGASFLRAFRATGEDHFIDAARAAGLALARAQSACGGWDRLAETAERDARDPEFERRPARATFDDRTSQGALEFLIELDALLDEPWLTDSIERAIAHHLEAQRADGAWPQWYPLRGGYRDLATYDDGATNDCVAVLLIAAERYGRPDCLEAALAAGDHIRRSQLAAPQAGWAPRYDDELRPAPARAFEPAAVCSAVTARNLRTLLLLHERTREGRFLEPLPAAIAWLERSRLPDGRWARFRELGTDRPIFADHDGSIRYELDEISAERRAGYSWHGTWSIPDTIAAARRALLGERAPPPRAPPARSAAAARLEPAVRAALEQLDESGLWQREGAVHAADFVRNATRLCEWLELAE